MGGLGPLYPVNLVLTGRRCLVVGAGRVAARKVGALLDAGADVRVVAPEVHEDLAVMADRLVLERRRWRPDDLDGVRLVVTATDDPTVNATVFAEAESRGIWCNSADDPANCSFTLPARVRRGDLLVTVATAGRSPAVAAWLRRRFAAELGPEYATLVDVVAEVRDELRARGVATEGLDWNRGLDSGMLEAIREGDLAEAKERLQACLSSSSD
jgi:precorrin-2 dehydrogenase/sirohydrochlorin ferrochelatase